MKEILEKWAKFSKEQLEKRQKVVERMALWNKENEFKWEGGVYAAYSYDFYILRRKTEEAELNAKFGVVDITFENLLNSLT